MDMFENIPDDLQAQTESFKRFFQCWMIEQDRDLQQLVSASLSRANLHHRHHEQQQQSVSSSSSSSSSSSPSSTLTITQEEQENEKEEEERVIRALIKRVVHHYDVYYQYKQRWVKQDVFTMLSASWRSTLEEAFLWIGGWRPSMAFHVLYSKSGLQLHARLDDIIIRGLSTGDLADLSASQLISVDELQRTTIREEREITEKMAVQQETVADSSMVELSHMVTELMRDDTELTQGGEVLDRVKSTLAPKQDELERIMESADDLRLRTLKGVIEILTPIQAVYFLIAAAELHLRLHDWGKLKDHTKNHGNGDLRETPNEQFSGSPSATTAAAAAGSGGGGEEHQGCG